MQFRDAKAKEHVKMSLKAAKSKYNEQDANAHVAVLEIVLHKLSTSSFLLGQKYVTPKNS